ncbi:MAG TPA: hypothetical protein VF210_15375 [Pseudomonadales bacterium]
MRLVTFDPFRTLGIPGVKYIKPELYRDHLAEIRAADWLLFPEYWQVNALIYAHRRRIFPSPAAYHLGHDKVQMTRALEARWPQHLPATMIRPATRRDAEEILERLGLPLVAKEVRSSEGRGVRLIGDEAEWYDYCAGRSVLYAQEYLPIDRDLRVVVIGRDVVASYWRLQPEGGFLNNVAAGGTLSFEAAPAAAVRLVERIARALRIDHAGFDVAIVGGRPYVLEFNRLFGNAGLREQGIRPAELIHRYLLARSPRKPRRPRAA